MSTTCTFYVNVTGTTAEEKNNSARVTSTEGDGNASYASVTVVAPPTIAKSFGAPTLSAGGGTTLTFALTNPNATTTLTGVGFTDMLPGGLVVSTPNGLTGTCGGGTITSVPGSRSVSLGGAGLGASASCTVTVNVTATGSGPGNNVTSVVTSVQGGNGGSASASLTVSPCTYSLSPLDL